MVGRNADAVLDKWKAESGIFYFIWRYLITAHIDDVAIPSLEPLTPLFVNCSPIGCVDDSFFHDRVGQEFITIITAHERFSFTADFPVFADDETCMLHRFAYTASQAFAVLEIIGGDDARLGGSIRIVKAALGQDKAKFLHIVLRDRSCACFDEFYSICILGKAVGSKCQQHPDACRNQECGKFSFSRGIHCLKETVDVFHSVDDVQGAAYEDDGIDLGETSDVAERTIDDEGQVVMKALCFYQIFSIGDDGGMGNHHSLRFAGCACREKYVGYSCWNGGFFCLVHFFRKLRFLF